MRLSAAEALVRFWAAQMSEDMQPLLGGVWAIFGHGNVGGLGQALPAVAGTLPTLRGHDEQAMGHAAIGFSRACRGRRAMAVTTSIGPGATNLVTAAATAHVNRVPLLLLPADGFAGRGPDPVLQQLEHPLGPDVSVNDCLRPVSRYFDRIERPEQLIRSLPEAARVLTDPVEAGPVTLCLPQDAQCEQAEFPGELFSPRVHRQRRPPPEPEALEAAARRLAGAKRVLVVAGGGVHRSGAEAALAALAEARGWPVAVTQAGKGCLSDEHPLSVGGIGVTGTSAANALAREADAVLAVGTRLSDFSTASGSLFSPAVALNIHPADAHKRGATPLICDARVGLDGLRTALVDRPVGCPAWVGRAEAARADWAQILEGLDVPQASLPSDAEVVRALDRLAGRDTVVVAAAGGLPGDLHKVWRARGPGRYLVEYGYSCMGHELAGALGVKLACPKLEVLALLGDGSFLMASSELATSVALGAPILAVVVDNQGFGCIDRLDRQLGGPGAPGNRRDLPWIDLELAARALGAHAETADLDRLPAALERARAAGRSAVVVVRTDPERSFSAGGAPWRVPSLMGGP